MFLITGKRKNQQGSKFDQIGAESKKDEQNDVAVLVLVNLDKISTKSSPEESLSVHSIQVPDLASNKFTDNLPFMPQ